MSETTPTPDRRRRPDAIDLAIIILSLVLVIGLLRMPTRYPAQPGATSRNDAYGLVVIDPPLRHDVVIDWRDPVVREWRRSSPLWHSLTGRLQTHGQPVLVRPWIYTDTWIPQPVVKVDRSGEFTAQALFDSRYDEPLVLTLEVEDLSSGRVVASYNYYFKKGS